MRDDQGNSDNRLPGVSEPEGSGISPSDERHDRGDSEQAGSVQAGSGQAGSGQAGFEQARPELADPGQARPGVADPGQARPAPDLPDLVKRDAGAGDDPGHLDSKPARIGPAYAGPGYSRPELEGPDPGLANWSAPLASPGGGGSQGQSGYVQPGSAQPGYGQPGYGQSTGPLGYGFTSSGPPGSGFPPPPGSGTGWGQPGYLPQQSAAARRRRSFLTYLTVAVVAAAAGAGLTGYALGGSGDGNPHATGSHRPGAGGGIVGGGAGRGINSSTERAAVSAVRPGMVDISSNLAYQGSQAAATGMVISSDGLVLTNNHVINGTTSLYARVLATGRRYSAQWVGYDATDDVAVIKLIGAHNLRTVPLGNSSTIKIGDRVIAIGNAYGAGRNPAYLGSVTGLNKTITASDSGAATKETLHNMMQINAGIVPGDSGGPLVSAAGRVIGMDTAAATGSLGTTTQNVGFAIPINRAMRIARQIISGRSSPTVQIGSTGFLGVLVPSRSASDASNPALQRTRQLHQDQAIPGGAVPPASSACLPTDLGAGVPAKVAPVSAGALIIGQLCGTPADKAGIVAGDVITSVGGHAVTSPKQLTSVMRAFRPGDPVKVVWVDVHGQRHTATLVLRTAPPR